jgi:hypothetical protein
MAHEEDFVEERNRILFVLSYMTKGSVELWADAYVEEALRISYWGLSVYFMSKLSTTFKDEEEGRRSLEAMAMLRQNCGSTADYFFHIEQLAHSTGINPEESHHVILQVERGVNLALISCLYWSTSLPWGYKEDKERIVTMDEMW